MATAATRVKSYSWDGGLVGLWGAIRVVTHQRAGARLRHRRPGGGAHARLPGGRHRQNLEAHLEAGSGLSGLAFDQQLVLAEPDQGFVRELRLLQVAQSRAVYG